MTTFGFGSILGFGSRLFTMASVRFSAWWRGTTSAVNIAALPLTGWWRSYPGSLSWSGESSDGASGTNALNAGTAPSAGTALNGYGTASFNGTTQYAVVNSSIPTMLGSTGWTFNCLVYLNSIPADTGAFSDPAIWSENDAGMGLGYSTSGVQLWQYDVGTVIRQVPNGATLTVGWNVIQARWTGTALECRANNGTWQSIACASMLGSMTTMDIGRNYDGTAFLNGTIADIFFTNTVLSRSDLDSIAIEMQVRYKVSLGFIILPATRSAGPSINNSLSATAAEAPEVGGNLNGHASAEFVNPILLPNNISLTGLWRGGQYTSPTWTGLASSGSSGGNNLTNAAGVVNGTGTGVGLSSADFNGTTSYLTGSTLATYFPNVNSWAVQVIFYARTSEADPGSPVRYNSPCLLSSNNGYFNIAFNSAGIFLVVYDSTGNLSTELNMACSTGAWHILQVSYDGTTYKLRIDGSNWATQVFDELGVTTDTFRVGANYNAAAVFDGEIQDILIADFLPTEAQLDALMLDAQYEYGLDGNIGHYYEVSGTVETYFGTTPAAWTIIALIKPTTLLATAGPTNDPAILTDAGGNIVLSVNSSGIQVTQYDDLLATFVSTASVPISTDQYSLVFARWDGATMGVKVNNGSWVTDTVTHFWASALPNLLFVGVARTFSRIYDGDIMELAITPTSLSDASITKLTTELTTRYAFPVLPAPAAWYDSQTFQTPNVTATEIDAIGDRSSNDYNLTSLNPNRPILTAGTFSNATKSSIDTTATLCYLSPSSKVICPMGFSAFVSFKTSTVDTTSSQVGINPPMTIVGDSSGSSYNNFGLNGNNVSYCFYSPSTYGDWHDYISSGLSLANGALHTIAVTHDKTTGVITLYADGVQVFTETITASDYNVTGVGFSKIGVGFLSLDAFTGHLAEVMVWNEALTAAKITELNTRALSLW